MNAKSQRSRRRTEAHPLGQTLRRVRAKLRLNQSQFARLLGVRQQAVSRWENGSTLHPLYVGLRLAALLQSAGQADEALAEICRTQQALAKFLADRRRNPNRRLPGDTAAWSGVNLDEPLVVSPTARFLAVRELPLSSRLAAILERMEIRRLGELDRRAPRDFYQFRGFGKKTLRELQTLLAQANAGEFDHPAADERTAPLRLLRSLETGAKQLTISDRNVLKARLGADRRVPESSDEIAWRFSLTRSGVYLKVDRAVAQIRKHFGPRIPRLLEMIKERTRRARVPLTPELLANWVGSPRGLQLPLAAHVRLVSLLDPSIRCLPTFRSRARQRRTVSTRLR